MAVSVVELAYRIMFELDGDVDKAVELIEQFMKKNEHHNSVVQTELAIQDDALHNDFYLTFDRFWDDYDKKVGYNKCKPKWLALTQAEKNLIHDYIPKYKEAQPNKKFRKNPETFLNNKGWLDEIIDSKEVEKKTDFTGTDYTLQA